MLTFGIVLAAAFAAVLVVNVVKAVADDQDAAHDAADVYGDVQHRGRR